MRLHDLDQAIRQLLAADDFSKTDASMNGLQIGDGTKKINKAALAVDACLASFELAADWGADVIITHHGLFWGILEPLTGLRYQRIKFLIDHNLALCAYHLPLDRHETLGNNAGLAHQLGLVDLTAFGQHRGQTIGWRGRFTRPKRLEEISEQLFGDQRGVLGHLPFGKEFNETVAIVSGGAAHDVYQAIDANIDLFITGDADHTIYHSCQEAGINVLFGGHYKTEVWGVSLLAKHLSAAFDIETRYFDIPTGL
jgi:dinuclear metal center YbgI/SA1388 family protein